MLTRISSLVALAALFAPLPAHPYAVTTGTTWATEAAIETLQQGGNAMDAMVAASFMLNVTLPYAMGIGGGGFLLVGNKGKVHFWSHREMAPASAHERMFLDSSGKPIREPDLYTGPNPVGVPGTIEGLYEAHQKFGRLPWKKLVSLAAARAREGFPLSSNFIRVLDSEWDRIKSFPVTASLYGESDGSHVKRGHLLRNAALGRTLDRIAEGGAAEFYTGALAHEWIAEAQKAGVKMTLDDLKNFKVRVEEPVAYSVFGLKAYTATPPSSAGAHLAPTLRYIERYYREHEVPPAASAARVIVTAEALRFFRELRTAKIADPPYGLLDPHKYIGSAEEKAAWAEIDKRVAEKLDRIQTKVTMVAPARAPLPEEHRTHTAHLSVADDHGMVVSYTTTIEELFGSGITLPAVGFMLNNELSDFTLEPGLPNSPAPGKRPRSNMSPTIFYDAANRPVGVVGCAGGGFIPTVLAELLENYYVHKMSAREAIAFPRFHPEDSRLIVESTMPQAVIKDLKTAGYTVAVEDFWSSAQALLRRDAKDRWEAATEPRADGLGIAIGR
jgi:gamma-glutamyltranspeptidase/glutathione hydrolase